MTIPPVIHYVWVGDQPLPRKYEINIASWRETNPEFEIRAWTNETIETKNPYLERCFAERNWANASNYLRFSVVHAHGGVYLDTDVMLLGSLKPMLKRKCFFGFQAEAQERDWVNNAVFGATAGHWFIRACMDRLVADFDGTEPANHSAPRLVTRMLVENGLLAYRPRGVDVKDIRVYPRPVFYPYKWNEDFSFDAVTDKTVAVHFWDKTWQRQVEDASNCDGTAALRERCEAAEAAFQQLVLRTLMQRRRKRAWRRWVDDSQHIATR